ncbi:MAG TPA: hypothetical protein VN663_06035, partial [Ramlibacter sp.]|nr:hypothetical protein [Ramlibacter sp.]
MTMTSTISAMGRSAKVAGRDVNSGLPVWGRLVLAIGLMLLVSWVVMIYLTYVAQREAAIGQARGFAASVTQMTTAALTGMMVSGTVKQRAVYLDQIKQANDINDLRALRGALVDAEYGADDTSS